MKLELEVDNYDILDQIIVEALKEAYHDQVTAVDEGIEFLMDKELLDALAKVIRYFSTEEEYKEFMSNFAS